MPRYKATIAYDGTNYCGFQTQENGHTVQAAIEKTLQRLNGGQEVTIYGSGRTDSGVHACGQVIHFDFPVTRDEEKFRHALDTQLPEDIAVLEVKIVSETFHARYGAREKTYHYRLDVGKPRSPFKRHYAAFYAFPLDIKKMQQAASAIVGTHDFSAFCASGSSVEDRVRTVHEATVTSVSENEILFTFRGNGFLYKMVRILVGTLLKIGNDRMPVEAISAIIESGDRNNAGPTAHPEGLYLMNVGYEKTESEA